MHTRRKNIAILNSAMIYGEDDIDLSLERNLCMEYVNNYDLSNFASDSHAQYNPYICKRAVDLDKNNIWLAKLYDVHFYIDFFSDNKILLNCCNKLKSSIVDELADHFPLCNLVTFNRQFAH